MQTIFFKVTITSEHTSFRQIFFMHKMLNNLSV